MKTLLTLTLLTMSLFASLAAPLLGGYRAIPATDAEALAAAKFAVTAHDPKLILVRLERAAEQVVAGMNYRLTLQVTDATGVAQAAEAVVWRKLDSRHELTSWNWTKAAPAHSQPQPQPQSGVLKTEFIYDTAPFASCHATTLAETTDGTLVAAWFGGTAEGRSDVGIWSARLVAGKWTAPVELATGVQADGKRHPCWNPVLFQPRDGALLLFYKVGPSPSTWWGMLRTSTDAGQTWSDATRLPDKILGPVKNKPVQLADGTLLSGSSTEGLHPPPSWQIHFERSTDNGKTWQFITVPQPTNSPSAIQPSILQLGGDKLMALGRTRSGKLFATTSADSGRTWTPTTLLDLPNPNSGTDAVTLKDGRHLLIYNHTAKGRSPLNLAVSPDGQTWNAALVLENTPGEYSYPAIIQTRDGLIHTTYTWKRQKVKHVVIAPAKLEARPITNGEWPK